MPRMLAFMSYVMAIQCDNGSLRSRAQRRHPTAFEQNYHGKTSCSFTSMPIPKCDMQISSSHNDDDDSMFRISTRCDEMTFVLMAETYREEVRFSQSHGRGGHVTERRIR